MKYLNNVLIKLIRGGFTDRVLYLDNVPEEFFFSMRHPMVCVGKGMEQNYVPDMSKEKVPTLHEELRHSLTGDNGIVFDLDNEQAKTRFLALNRYINSVYTNKSVPADPVVNSIDPQDPSATALELSKIPRVALPVLSPAELKPSVSGEATASFDIEAVKKQAVAEYKEQQREKMAKARDARKAPVGKNVQ